IWRDTLAGDEMLRTDDGRPVAAGPSRARGDRTVGHEGRVRLIPLRTLPPRGLQEVGAQLLLARVEGADAQRPGLLHGLQWVDDVVDLDKCRRAACQQVGGAVGECLEAMDVALAYVDARDARDDP